MFLLTFVTLMVAFIGVYAQVLGLQTARFYASQRGIAQEMQIWHSAATSMAASIIKTNLAGYGGVPCSLTFIVPAGSAIPGSVVTPCPSPKYMGAQQSAPNTGSVATINATFGSVTDGTPSLNLINVISNPSPITYTTACVHLPVTAAPPVCTTPYDINDYQFYSVLYRAANNQDYVVTFVQAANITAANPAPGLLNLAITPTNAAGFQIGLTSSDLLRQFRNTGMPNYSYGTISGAQLTASGGLTINGAFSQVLYPLPAAFNDAGGITNINGAVGIISSPDGF